MLFRKFLLTSTVAVVVGLIAPAVSQAQFSVDISVAGGENLDLTTSDFFVIPLLNGGVEYQATKIISGYEISITATTNSPGGGALGTPLLSTVGFTITGQNNQTASAVTITTTSGGFQASPSGTPVNLFNSVSTTLLSTANGSNLQGYSSASGLGNTQTVQLTNTTNNPNTNLSGGSSESGILTYGGNSFSISNTAIVNGLSAGQEDNFTVTTNLVPTPAPSGLILATTMVPFFGLLRRRLRGLATPVAA